MKSLVVVFLSLTLLTACSDWIFRIDVPQGNFLEQDDVDLLRVDMTKEQVVFVLGNPVVQDSFNSDTWYYFYEMKRGMSKRGPDVKKQLILNFEDGRLTEMSGDFEKPEEFNIPLA